MRHAHLRRLQPDAFSVTEILTHDHTQHTQPVNEYYPAEDYHQKYLEKGGRFGRGQSAAKGCTDPIRCYG